jgi:hypothetical protein
LQYRLRNPNGPWATGPGWASVAVDGLTKQHGAALSDGVPLHFGAQVSVSGSGSAKPSFPAPKSIHPSGERAAGEAGRAAAAGMVTDEPLDRLDFELEDDPLFSTPRPTKR